MKTRAVNPKRIVLKLSGEAFKAPDGIFSAPFAANLIRQFQTVVQHGYEVIIVLGGGNICRSQTLLPFKLKNYTNLDYAGMLATVINTLALKALAWENYGLKMPALSMVKIDEQVIGYYNPKLAETLLNQHKLLIVCGGIGVPCFTTDTAASVLANQLQAKQILLGKKDVDGVFDKDPLKFSNAKMYKHITFQTLILKRLQIFDLTAASFNIDKEIELLVFNLSKADAIVNVLQRKGNFTVINNHE